MEIIRDPLILQKLVLEKKSEGHSIGFVPTMGALHQGHISLVKKSCEENTLNIVSIFVNPTQFNQQEDFDNYPQTLDADLRILSDYPVDFIFCPNKESLYPDNYNYTVQEHNESQLLCGKSRPGHFQGVLTVVLKLLNIVQPTKAYFGEKDFQQLQLIKNMVAAFFIPTQIVSVPIVRDYAGLALSSRNQRLSPQGLEKAQLFAKILKDAADTTSAYKELESNHIQVDYLEEIHHRRFGAVVVDNVRLIDNVQI